MIKILHYFEHFQYIYILSQSSVLSSERSCRYPQTMCFSGLFINYKHAVLLEHRASVAISHVVSKYYYKYIYAKILLSFRSLYLSTYVHTIATSVAVISCCFFFSNKEQRICFVYNI